MSIVTSLHRASSVVRPRSNSFTRHNSQLFSPAIINEIPLPQQPKFSHTSSIQPAIRIPLLVNGRLISNTSYSDLHQLLHSESSSQEVSNHTNHRRQRRDEQYRRHRFFHYILHLLSQGKGRFVSGLILAALSTFLSSHPVNMVAALSSNPDVDSSVPQLGGNGESTDPDALFKALSLLAQQYCPMLTQLGFGGMMGFTAGYAAKKVGKSVVFIGGVAFMGLQVLSYCDLVDIKWQKIEERLTQLIDQDGDGQVSDKDINALIKKFTDVFQHGITASVAFSTGFLLGLKSG